MSELTDANIPFEKRYFDPESESIINASPLDPYEDRVIQFAVLKQMGYPVDLQRIPVEDLPEDFFLRNEAEWERDNFPMWARPVVHDSGFERFIECLDVPGDRITSDDEELNEQLWGHPVKLIWEVDSADAHMLAYYIDCFENDRLRYVSDVDGGLLTRDLLIGCFMAALERYADRRARGYQSWRDTTTAAVTTDDFVRHKIYEMEGFRPASPEQLGALVMDYYKLAERADPEILQFKDRGSGL